MTTEHLLSIYKLSADDLDEMLVKTTITFTKPIEVLHRYDCDFNSFNKLFKPNKNETKEEFRARLMAAWVSLIINGGDGSSDARIRPDVEIDYDRIDCEQEEEDDGDEPTMLAEIKQSVGQAYQDYQRTLPEEVARREALRAAVEKKKADERKAEQVATLKKMLADLGEKV
jgi:hypothetical protein